MIEPPRNKPKNFGLDRYAIVGLAVLVAGGGYLFSKFSRAIAPGAGFSLSTSMKPETFVFRNGTYSISGKRVRAKPPVRWELELPRAFVISQQGGNDAVMNGESMEEHRSAVVSAVLDDETGELVPATHVEKSESNVNQIIIRITNYTTDYLASNNVNCLTSQEKSTLIGSIYKCNSDNTRRCDVYAHYKGWSVNMMVRNEKMASRGKFCAAVFSFLDKHTKHIDPGYVEDKESAS